MLRSDIDTDAVGRQWRRQSTQSDVRDDEHGSRLDIGHEHRELVATETAHHRVGAECHRQPIGGSLDDLVADVVSERVVDFFEVVEVDDHQALSMSQ